MPFSTGGGIYNSVCRSVYNGVEEPSSLDDSDRLRPVVLCMTGCSPSLMILPRRNHSRALKQGMTSFRLYTFSVFSFIPLPEVRALTCTAVGINISCRLKCRLRTYNG